MKMEEKVLKIGIYASVEKCKKCGKKTENFIYLNGEPYHPKCASKIFEEKK